MAVNRIEHKLFEADGIEFFTKQAGGHGAIKGYVATYGNLDRQGDIIMPGAFDKSLDTFMRNGFLALSHDPNRLPIGVPIEAKSDDMGLLMGFDMHSTQSAQDARTVSQERLAAGKTVSFSIGYMVPTGGEERRKDGTRLLKQIDLVECSLVTIPANPMAQALTVKDASSQPEGGMTLSDQADVALAAVEPLRDRLKAMVDLRTKVGRRISSATGAKIRQLAQELLSLLDDAAGGSASDDDPAELESPPLEQEPKQQEAPKERKQETKPQGTAGTVGYYRRHLSQIETWAIRNGMPIYTREIEAAQREKDK